jgi:hypothetical protein
VQRAILIFGIAGSLVLGLGAAGWFLFGPRTGLLAPDDGLDCASAQRGFAVMETTLASGIVTVQPRSADEAIEHSDLWSFYDIPKTAWRLATGDEAPQNGIMRVEPLVETTEERTEYLVYVNGRGTLRVNVTPFEGRYSVTGWTHC